MPKKIKITEQQKLALLLGHMGATLLGVTLGDGDPTEEETAQAIRKSIIAVRRADPSSFRDIDLSI